MRRAALLLLALLAASALLPLAGADHVYSHRYLVVGRVVDAAGNPVRNATVQIALDEQLQVQGPCGTQPRTETEAWGVTITRPVTNDLGEFMFCYHVHVVPSSPPDRFQARVEGVDASTQTLTMDPDFRASYVILRLPGAAQDTGSFAGVATLAGRVWRPQANAVLEGVPVNGVTVNQAPVNITFEHDGVNETFRAATNNYGDFALRVNLSAPVRNGTMVAESFGQTFVAPYHADAAIAYAKMSLAAPGATDGVEGARDAPPAPATRATPGLGLVASLAILATVALLARPQMRGGA